VSLNTPIRVLVVEDDPDSSDALQLLLEHEGFEVHLASSVSETRRHFESHADAPADVVVLDLGLPDYSPILLAEEFRRLEPSPGIIVHSAAPQEIVNAAAICLGAVGKVRKPSNCRDLVRLIRAAAERTLPAVGY
jgi:DNA-binding response OmpR family regulator